MAPRGKHYIKGTVSQYFPTETLRWLEVGSYKLGCTAGNVPDTASYIRGWIQMVLTPNDLFSWNNKYSKYTIILSRLYALTTDSLFIFQLCTSTYSVHAGILKLWRGRLPCPLVVFSFHYVSRLSFSFVRSQLTLPVPAMRIRSPLSQDGAPIHRVRTHSLSRVQHR